MVFIVLHNKEEEKSKKRVDCKNVEDSEDPKKFQSGDIKVVAIADLIGL